MNSTEWIEQWICIKFCIKLEHSSTETIQMIQKATGRGNWWLEASSPECATHASCLMAEFFGETWNPPGDSAFLQPRSGALWVLAFPQTKITFEREEISECRWDSENMMGQLLVIGRTVWSPKVPTLKGTEVSWSYVQYFLYLVSSSINVSIFSYYMAVYLLDRPHIYFLFMLQWSIHININRGVGKPITVSAYISIFKVNCLI